MLSPPLHWYHHATPSILCLHGIRSIKPVKGIFRVTSVFSPLDDLRKIRLMGAGAPGKNEEPSNVAAMSCLCSDLYNPIKKGAGISPVDSTTALSSRRRTGAGYCRLTCSKENTFSDFGSTVISTQLLSSLPNTSTRVKFGVSLPSYWPVPGTGSLYMGLSILK